MSLAAPAAVVNLNTVDREYGVLEELASRVVSGKAAKASVVSNTQIFADVQVPVMPTGSTCWYFVRIMIILGLLTVGLEHTAIE